MKLCLCAFVADIFFSAVSAHSAVNSFILLIYE